MSRKKKGPGDEGQTKKPAKAEAGFANAPFGDLKALREKMKAEEAARAAKSPAGGASGGFAKGAGAPGSGAASSTSKSPAWSTARADARSPSGPASPSSRGGTRSPREPDGDAAPALDGEDALAFHRLMSGVVPLDAAKSARVPKTHAPSSTEAGITAARRHAEGQTAQEAEAAEVHEHLRALVEGRTRFEVTDDGRRVEGRRIDLPPDVLRKLRHGVLPIDARLDLHGRTVVEAREELEGFLRDKRARGERCVLVVHGKGAHSPRGAGVLRGEMAAWLSQGGASEHVAAFATAADGDGGEGAVYVLLRR